MSEENDKLAKLYEDTAKKILDAMNEKDTRIKALEQQLKEKEESLEAKQNAIDAISFNTIDLSKKLSEAEARVKELEHFISVSVDCHLLEKFNQVVADKEKLESAEARVKELEGKYEAKGEPERGGV